MGPITSPVKVSVREDQVLPLQFDVEGADTLFIHLYHRQSVSTESSIDKHGAVWLPPNFFGLDTLEFTVGKTGMQNRQLRFGIH